MINDNNKEIKITVLMPVYNGEKYLEESIDSVSGQTLSDFEIIIIDDGSTDNTRKIIEEFDDPRIRYFKNEKNLGIVDSLNRGIAEAKGKYVARQDADDISLPSRFEAQIKYLEKHPECVAVGSQMREIDKNGNFIGWRLVPLWHKDIETLSLKGRGGQIPHPTAMCRTSALEKIGGYRKRYESAEDLDLFLRLAECGRLANLPNVLVYYRIHSKSISMNNREKQISTVEAIVSDALARRKIVAKLNPGWLFYLKMKIQKKILSTYLKIVG